MNTGGQFFQFIQDLTPPIHQRTAFVVMPFDKSFDYRYRELIKKPLETGLGFTVNRTDEIYGTTAIMGKIVQALQHSRLVLADLTGRNPNVMFELGLACGFSKDILLLASHKADIPEDLRHLTFCEIDDSQPDSCGDAIVRHAQAIMKSTVSPEPITSSQRLWYNTRYLGLRDIIKPDAEILASYALSATKSVEAIGLTGQFIFNLALERYKVVQAHMLKLEGCVVLPRPSEIAYRYIDNIDGTGKGIGKMQLPISIKRFLDTGMRLRLTDDFVTWGGLFIDGRIGVIQFYYPGIWKTHFVIIEDAPGGMFHALYSKFQQIRDSSVSGNKAEE